ncbi:MAG: DNA-binding protein [Clostridia bacterium]|nr:DNA-binding protein [Clostridia bacterium]
MFQKSLEIGYLLDFYGELLKDRRCTVLDMYYNEDMSLSEIADALGITRQGARDLIKKAGDELLLFEDKLQMAKKFRNLCECTDNAEQIIKSNADDKDSSLLTLLSEIRQIIEN